MNRRFGKITLTSCLCMYWFIDGQGRFIVWGFVRDEVLYDKKIKYVRSALFVRVEEKKNHAIAWLKGYEIA